MQTAQDNSAASLHNMAGISSSDAKKYKKLTHREHVLHRPGMYMGSTVAEPTAMWVMDPVSGRMERREGLQYVPALAKLLDECITNAVDHSIRLKSEGSKSLVKRIDVTIDKETGVIQVSNDGEGVPVEKVQDGSCYVPEMVFGQLLTSTNYDDDEQRTVGGTNGLGVKICNIMSEWFEIRTVDATRSKMFEQRYEKNMSVCHPPVVKAAPKKEKAGTTVRFLPDYARFGMSGGGMTDDMYLVCCKRAYDATAVTGSEVAVSLNGEKIEIKTFEKYVDLYIGSKGDAGGARVYEAITDGWEVACGLTSGVAEGLQQISFVNGVPTLRGGKHVDHIVNQICRKVGDLITASASKSKGGGGGGAAAAASVRPQFIKDNLFVFVRATVPNPSFDSQAKETLTTPSSKWGVTVQLSDKFAEKVSKLDGLMDRVMSMSAVAADKTARKTDGNKRSALYGIPKLDDAEWAGTGKSAMCSLLLTEGDSAKASAVAGLAVVGRQKWGVFPLRGKIMNVCDMTADRIGANAEIAALKKILGLQTGKSYSDVSELRYGRVIILSDADHDGTHIRGLVMNLFAQQWPSLLKLDGFFCAMLTPVVKSWSGSGPQKIMKEFYTVKDFEDWRADIPEDDLKRWSSKYFKGLGTSTPDEAREWFKRLKVIAYAWDEESSGRALSLAFDKKRADERKAWLEKGPPPPAPLAILPPSSPVRSPSSHDLASLTGSGGAGSSSKNPPRTGVKSIVTHDAFINNDLIHFSLYDVQRSIPSAIDGLKVSQRKALFGCFKRNLVKEEVRVAQLAAYVSEHACFHHGESSMQGTIVSLAQDFVGSNNIPLLEPIGQFGSRLSGGQDAASARYIHTRLARLTRIMFPKADDAILEYLDDDGTPVQPKHYVPIIPLVLINGAIGIGTGYSTNVPCYHPMDVVQRVRSQINTMDEDGVEDGVEDDEIAKDEPNDDGDGDDQEDDGENDDATKDDDTKSCKSAKSAMTSMTAKTSKTSKTSKTWTSSYCVPSDMKPWYRGFTGRICHKVADTNTTPLVSSGVVTRTGPTTLRITELPIGTWTEDFKVALEKLIEENSDIKGFSNASFDTTVDFTIQFTNAASLDAWLAPSTGSAYDCSVIEAALKLTSAKGLSTTNMHLFDSDGNIKKFKTPEMVIDHFIPVRLEAYRLRKEFQLATLLKEEVVLANKVRFLDMVIQGDIVLQRAEGDDDLSFELHEKGFSPDPYNNDNDDNTPDNDASTNANNNKRYRYLTSMPLSSLTRSKKTGLEAELERKRATIQELRNTTERELWTRDLDAFMAAYVDIYGDDVNPPPSSTKPASSFPVVMGASASAAAATTTSTKTKPRPKTSKTSKTATTTTTTKKRSAAAVAGTSSKATGTKALKTVTKKAKT